MEPGGKDTPFRELMKAILRLPYASEEEACKCWAKRGGEKRGEKKRWRECNI